MSGYIGTQPVPQATQTRDSFTATSGQTTFATGGYTPNFLDVYLNGVKLAAADYTATNGSDVVLASGASTGDILEVVAFTTFNSASSSIDDNGNATALTIDSSENVLIGQSTSNFATKGIRLRGDVGQMTATRDGGAPVGLNRLTSDGSMLDFNKDGTTVGSIGAGGGRLYLGSADTGIYFDEGVDSIYAYNPSTGQTRDNAIDLGYSTIRYKDLYLSGGVYLGGTGSANKLEDYEEGTFTPIITVFSGTNPTLTYSRQSGVYIKVGDLVYVSMIIDVSSASSLGSGLLQIGPLPFAIRAGEEAEGVSNTSSITPARGNYVSTGCHSIVQTQMGFLTSNNGAGWSWETTSIMPTSACAFRISTTYRV